MAKIIQKSTFFLVDIPPFGPSERLVLVAFVKEDFNAMQFNAKHAKFGRIFVPALGVILQQHWCRHWCTLVYIGAEKCTLVYIGAHWCRHWCKLHSVDNGVEFAILVLCKPAWCQGVSGEGSLFNILTNNIILISIFYILYQTNHDDDGHSSLYKGKPR